MDVTKRFFWVESFGFCCSVEKLALLLSNVVLVIVLPMYSGERNHLDLWVVISQMSTIGVGQWQMHLSTSSSAQGYPGVLRCWADFVRLSWLYAVNLCDQMVFTLNWHEKWHLFQIWSPATLTQAPPWLCSRNLLLSSSPRRRHHHNGKKPALHFSFQRANNCVQWLTDNNQQVYLTFRD